MSKKRRTKRTYYEQKMETATNKHVVLIYLPEVPIEIVTTRVQRSDEFESAILEKLSKAY